GLDRHPERTELVFVALEHLLEGVGPRARVSALPVPGHAVEDLLLGEPDLRGHQRHDEIRQTLLRGNPGSHHCVGTGAIPRMSITTTLADPPSVPGMTRRSCDP